MRYFFRRITFVGSLLLLTQTLLADESRLPIDLNHLPILVRKSFDPAWVENYPSQQEELANWTTVKPKESSRPVHLSELNLTPNSANRFRLSRQNTESFTMLVRFDLNDDEIRGATPVGLFLGSIGENWEVYLNGKLLRSEVHLNSEKNIDQAAFRRNEIIMFDQRALQPTGNLLAFHILGDPASIFTGFLTGQPFLIDRLPVLLERQSETIPLILLSLYCFIGLYHLLLFVRRRSERYNLTFALVSMELSLYLFTRSNAVFKLGLNTDLISKVELIALFMNGSVLLIFFQQLMLGKTTRFVRVSAYSFLALTATVFVLPAAVSFDLMLKTWQIAVCIHTMGYGLYFLSSQFVLRIEDFRGRMSRSRAFVHALLYSIPGNLLFGTIGFMVTALIDIMNSFTSFGGVIVTVYSFFLFITGIAFILTNKFVNVFNEADRLNADLKKLDRLKDEFLANTSHELRTPLNGIMGLAEATLVNPEDKEQVIRNSEMIVSSGRRLSSLVNDILDFSKMRNADLQLQIQPVDIKKIAELAVMLSAPLAKSKNLDLKIDMPEELPLIDADENRLQQVILNLLGNALKFTQQGSVTIKGEHLGNSVKVSVIDTGIGIPPDKRQVIFESFQQADGSIAREFGGTGLGLTIVKNLLTLHGSAIEVESEQGKGSTFHFTLPVSGAQTRESTPVAGFTNRLASDVMDESLVRKSEDPGKPGKSQHVLVVDDEPVNVTVLETHLKAAGYRVTTASDGYHALERIKEEIPDVLLLDLMMPRMSGLEVCRTLRETNPASLLPIVILSAKNQVSDLVEALEAGANDYLTKPFSRNELLARINVHLELRNSVREQMYLSRSFERFVPSKFLELLGKDSITEIKLGDSTLREMSVLFSDIRSFTNLSEQMSPEDNFKFLNSYLKRMEPAIHRQGGFVDKFIGDAIMSLFREDNGEFSSADRAVASALDMRAEMKLYNVHRIESGYSPIETGIGINTGPMILGTVGSPNRLDTTVIGNTVNLASRLESLTAFYQCGVIISDYTFRALRARKDVLAREIGAVTVKGKAQPVGVYEVFEGDDDRLKELKLQTRADLYTGIIHFKLREFRQATSMFAQVLAKNPEDHVAEIYLRRCGDLIANPPAEHWQGQIEMLHK